MVNPKTTAEQSQSGKPGPPACVQQAAAPGPGDGAGDDPHCHPQWNQHTMGRAAARAPISGERVNGEPESRDGGVDHTGKPSYESEDREHGRQFSKMVSGGRVGDSPPQRSFISSGYLQASGRGP